MSSVSLSLSLARLERWGMDGCQNCISLINSLQIYILRKLISFTGQNIKRKLKRFSFSLFLSLFFFFYFLSFFFWKCCGTRTPKVWKAPLIDNDLFSWRGQVERLAQPQPTRNLCTKDSAHNQGPLGCVLCVHAGCWSPRDPSRSRRKLPTDFHLQLLSSTCLPRGFRQAMLEATCQKLVI